MVDLDDADIKGTRGVSPRTDANWPGFVARLQERWGGLAPEELESHATRRDELIDFLDERLDEPRMRIVDAVERAQRETGFRWD